MTQAPQRTIMQVDGEDPYSSGEKLRVLASYPKSGSTWLRQMLFDFFEDRDDAPALNDMSDNRFFTLDDGPWIYEAAYGIDPATMTREQGLKLRFYNYTFLRRVMGAMGIYPCIKTHSTNGTYPDRLDCDYINWDEIHSAVVLVRNPLDVCVSFAHHLQKSVDETADIMGREYFALRHSDDKELTTCLDTWSAWVMHWGVANIHGDKTIAVRYEDMKAKPETVLAAVLEHFDIEGMDDKARIARAVERCDLRRLKAMEAETPFAERSKKADGGFFGGEREPLTDYARQKIVSDHREVMERYGYLERNTVGSELPQEREHMEAHVSA